MNATVEAISGSTSLSVTFEGDENRIWYLVRDPESTHPEVVSIPHLSPYWQSKRSLKADSNLYNRVMKVVTSRGQFKAAMDVFDDVRANYVHYGADDTEPRGAMVDVLERLLLNEKVSVPNANVNGWDLYSSMPGHREANRALSRHMREVVKAARADRQGLATWLKDNYGIEVF